MITLRHYKTDYATTFNNLQIGTPSKAPPPSMPPLRAQQQGHKGNKQTSPQEDAEGEEQLQPQLTGEQLQRLRQAL
eukprot:4212222-Amphidinium_carterae.1